MIFAIKNLMPREIVCYHALLLREWTKRLQKSPRKPQEYDGMEEVKKTRSGSEGCDCIKNASKEPKDEL